MNYWSDKEKLTERARLNNISQEFNHKEEIAECIKNSKVYGGLEREPKRSDKKHQPQFVFLNTDSVSALKRSKIEKKAVLNFASYKHPGGGYLNGSSAQEEALCHASFLYSVLKEFPEYYAWNNDNKNRALYYNRAIYSPKVLFEDTECDVITCAAPNIGVGLKYGTVSLEENYEVLKSRLEFIRDIAEENNIETLILGAFGCGVFRQDPYDVAKAIKEVFKETSIYNIVLPVPGSDRNYTVFYKEFVERKGQI